MSQECPCVHGAATGASASEIASEDQARQAGEQVEWPGSHRDVEGASA